MSSSILRETTTCRIDAGGRTHVHGYCSRQGRAPVMVIPPPLSPFVPSPAIYMAPHGTGRRRRSSGRSEMDSMRSSSRCQSPRPSCSGSDAVRLLLVDGAYASDGHVSIVDGRRCHACARHNCNYNETRLWQSRRARVLPVSPGPVRLIDWRPGPCGSPKHAGAMLGSCRTYIVRS